MKILCWILINNYLTKRLLYPKNRTYIPCDCIGFYFHMIYILYIYIQFIWMYQYPYQETSHCSLIGYVMPLWWGYLFWLDSNPPLSHILTTPRLRVISWSFRKITCIRWRWGRYNTCIHATPSYKTSTIKRQLVRWMNEVWNVWLGTN